MIGKAAFVAVMVALAVTALAQARPVRRHRMLLDTLAIVPQWRFFAVASIAAAADFAGDTHLVIRDRDAHGRIGGWTPVLWPVDRRLLHAVWNTKLRTDDTILSMGEDLARACAHGMSQNVQQSRSYLILLRRAFEAERTRADSVGRQFAVVRTIGRVHRAVSIEFLSAWHRW